MAGGLTAIEDGVDADDLVIDPVVDREGETAGQQTVETMMLLVHTGVQEQGVDVGKEGIEEILAQPR